MSCGVGHRHSLDPELRWLWHWLWRWLADVALIQLLAWKLTYAKSVALKKRKNETKQNKTKKPTMRYHCTNNRTSLIKKKKTTKKQNKKNNRGSRHGTAETNPTRNHEVLSLIPGLAQWVKDLVLP